MESREIRISEMRSHYFDNAMRVRKYYGRGLDPICSQWDLTRNELDVLLFLYNNPQYDRAADVAVHRGMAKSHVSLSVNNLEAKGLLCRTVDETDRRTVHLKLMGEAWDIARQGREAQVAFFTKLYQGLSAQEVEGWMTVMEKIMANINDLE